MSFAASLGSWALVDPDWNWQRHVPCLILNREMTMIRGGAILIIFAWAMETAGVAEFIDEKGIKPE
jgi:hypothetical protein